MRYALGVDIGGTHTKLGIVDQMGQVTHASKFPTNARGHDPSAFLQSLEANIHQTLTAFGGKIAGMGLSVHGHIDKERRRQIVCNNTPALRGVSLFDFIEHRFGYQPVINNDLTAHALAEYHFGTGNGAARFLCLAIGTGLGAGVIVNGEPLRYIDGTPGDTGRVILDPSGPKDVYGVRGSAEAFCGVAGIARLASEKYGYSVEAHEVIAAAKQGEDEIAVAVMRQIGEYIGQTLAVLSPIFLPERIALTGGTTECGPIMLGACRNRFFELVGAYHDNLSTLAPNYYSPIQINYGAVNGESAVIGAAIEILITPNLSTDL